MSFDASSLGGPYRTVIDVGAFRGDFARSAKAAWPDANVVCFEPLEQRPAALANEDATWYPVVLGASEGATTIHECEFLPSSSVLRMTEAHKEAFPYTREHQSRYVAMRRLDEYRGVIVGPALLKIDTQGYELEVLRGAEDVLPLVAAVVLEVSWEELYEGAPSFEEVDAFLSERGFRHDRRVDELAHPRTRLLLQSDELWLS